MNKNEINGQNSVATSAKKAFTFRFCTNGGPKVVEITDKVIENFILAVKDVTDQYGAKPNHPLDFMSIAEQLWFEDKITEEDYDYYYGKFKEIWKSFKYDNK